MLHKAGTGTSAEEGMKIDVTALGDITIVRPFSDIRVKTLVPLKNVFEKLIKDDMKKVALDLTHVGSIDSSGVGILVNYGKRQKSNNGHLCLYNYSQELKELLDFVDMGNFIPVCKSFSEVKTMLSGSN